MNWHLTLHFMRQELAHKYAQTFLGGLWSVIYPLIYIAIFILVFSKIMGAKLSIDGLLDNQYGYSIYLIAGMLPWTFFANSVNRTSSVFLDKAGLLSKVNISMAQLPLAIIGSELVVLAVSYVFFALFLLAIGYPMQVQMLWLLPVVLVHSLLIYGVGLLLAVLVVFSRDLKEIINVVLQIWFWLTPIVYLEAILPDSYQWWFDINPISYVIDMYRAPILHGQEPDFKSLVITLLLATALIAAARKLFKGLEGDIRDLL